MQLPCFNRPRATGTRSPPSSHSFKELKRDQLKGHKSNIVGEVVDSPLDAKWTPSKFFTDRVGKKIRKKIRKGGNSPRKLPALVDAPLLDDGPFVKSKRGIPELSPVHSCAELLEEDDDEEESDG